MYGGVPTGTVSSPAVVALGAAGAGVEGVIVGNWSWRLEYLHIDLGNVNMSFATLLGCYGFAVACGPVTAGTGSISSHVTDEIGSVGFDYRFGAISVPQLVRSNV